MKASPIVILDATSMLFRAFHAAPSQKAPNGSETGALASFTAMLLKLIRKASSRHFVVVFDAEGKTFRHRISAEYKAHRKPQPTELRAQANAALQVCRKLGLLSFRVDDVEADDVIATLTRQARNEGAPVWIVSPDKDLFQLVDDTAPSVSIWRMAKREIVDAKRVEALIGVNPDRAVTYFALVGDSSDNVRGVRGVGPKAAASIVKRFGTLEEIYANLVRMWSLPVRGAKTLADKLKASREEAFVARHLVTLRDDVPLELTRRLVELALWTGPTSDAEATFYPLGMGNLLTHAQRLSGDR